MRGRKPKTISPGTSPVKKVPSAPDYLPMDGKSEWKRVAPILVNERKVLTEADLATLENYCLAVGTMREARRILNVQGLVLDNGKRNPAVGIMNSAQNTQRLCAAELGLTPVSRSRPAIRDDGDDDVSPLDF